MKPTGKISIQSVLIAFLLTALLAHPAVAKEEEKSSRWDWFKDIYHRGGGTLQLHYAYDTEDDDQGEDLWDSRLKFSLWAEFKPWKKAKAKLSVITFQSVAGREPDKSVVLEDIYRIPNEAYLTQSIWKFDITAGYQKQTWGINKFLSPTNNLNPMEMRGFIDPDPEDLIIPIPMVKTVLFITDFIFLEGVYIPMFFKSQFHVFHTDFALCQGQGICPVNPSENLREEDIPYPDQWETGLRIRAEVDDFTFEASYLLTREDFPVFMSKRRADVTYDDIYIERQYPTYHIAGGGVGWEYKKVALKVEGAYSPEREFTTLDWFFYNKNGDFRPVFSSIKSEYYAWAMEASYSPSKKLYLLAGFEEMKVPDATPDMLLSSETTQLGLLMVKITALREQLIIKLGLLYFIEDEDFIVGPRVAYKPTDDIELGLGANILEGERADTNQLGGVAPVSLYGEADQVFAGFRYTF